MAAHTFVASYTDAQYFITATLPATYTQAGYTNTAIVWTAIGKVKTFIPYGSKRPINEWAPIRGAVEYSKGAPRYGSADMTLGDVPADAGQVIMKAAEASANHYSMLIIYPDGEKHYLDILVAGWQLVQAGEGVFMERMCTLSVCKDPVIVAAPA